LGGVGCVLLFVQGRTATSTKAFAYTMGGIGIPIISIL